MIRKLALPAAISLVSLSVIIRYYDTPPSLNGSASKVDIRNERAAAPKPVRPKADTLAADMPKRPTRLLAAEVTDQGPTGKSVDRALTPAPSLPPPAPEPVERQSATTAQTAVNEPVINTLTPPLKSAEQASRVSSAKMPTPLTPNGQVQALPAAPQTDTAQQLMQLLIE